MKSSFRTFISCLFITLLVAISLQSSNALPAIPKSGQQPSNVADKAGVNDSFKSITSFKESITTELGKISQLKGKKADLHANQLIFDSMVNKTIHYWNEILIDITVIDTLKLTNTAQKKTPNLFLISTVKVFKYGSMLQGKTLTLQSVKTKDNSKSTNDQKDENESKVAWLEMLKTVCYVESNKLPLRFIPLYKQFIDGLPELTNHSLSVSGLKINDDNQLFYKTWSRLVQEIDFCVKEGQPKTAIKVINKSNQLELDLNLIVSKINYLEKWFKDNKPAKGVIVNSESANGKDAINIGNHLHNTMVNLHTFYTDNIVQL